VRRQRRPWLLLAALLAAACAAGSLAGQQEVPQAQVRVEEGPYYAGVPVRLKVVARGFEEAPQPRVEVDDPPGGRLTPKGVSPSVSTSITIINGRRYETKDVSFAFDYDFVAEAPGSWVLGPFRLVQNGREASTGTQRLTLGEIPVTSDQELVLVLPDGPLIVGQRLPVRLEWWTPMDLRGKLYTPRLTVPLFDRLDAFRFHEVPDPSADIALPIDTASGPLELPATTRRELHHGRAYLVRTITREITPLKAGEYELAPARLVVDEVVRWRRTLFDDRIPAGAAKRRVEDVARTLVVRDLPAAGRPESFTGTVGRGYRLTVAADRSVVQVGDPIRLTLSLEGDTGVETAVLPPLTADGGLSPRDFRIPPEQPAGVLEQGVKRFEVSVRALHEGVTEIPPVAFSWYDPVEQAYQTTRSHPIALSVRPAQVVSAADVISAAPGAPPAAVTPAAPDQEVPAEGTEGAGPHGLAASRAGALAFNLTGADLAIATDIDLLMRPRGSWATGPSARIGAYGLGLAALLGAWLARRRAQADPEERERAKALRAQCDALAAARTVGEASGALRRMVATSAARPPPELDAFLAACDAYAFAPGGATHRLDEAMRARALALADRILKGGVR